MAKGKKIKRGRGRPKHVPSDKTRAEVSAFQICGVQHAEIAKLIGISLPTLLKHYRQELDEAEHRANAEVNNRLFAHTKTNPGAAIFWHKARMHWRETHVIAGDPTAPLIPPKPVSSDVTAESALAAYLELVAGKK